MKENNIDLILFLLKQLPGFNLFVKFNSLKEENIKSTIPFIKPIFFKKGTRIFQQGDQTNTFYCVIKGKISLRLKNKNSITKITKDSVKSYRSNDRFLNRFGSKNLNEHQINCHKQESEEIETEKFQYANGDCFGEWAIIYKEPRAATAYTLEDSHLFYMDKDDFCDHLAKSVIKADVERKNFLKSCIKTFNNVKRFEYYFKKIDFIFPTRNNLVFPEAKKSRQIYLIYQGEFILQKKFIVDKKNCSNDFSQNFDRSGMRKILKLEKGAIAGLECIFEPEGVYNYSLFSLESEFNNLFRIDLDHMEEYKEAFLEDLKEIYKNQNTLLKENFNRQINLKLKSSIRYRNLIPKSDELQLSLLNAREIEMKKEFFSSNKKHQIDILNIGKKSRNEKFVTSQSNSKISLNKTNSNTNCISKSTLNSARKNPISKTTKFKNISVTSLNNVRNSSIKRVVFNKYINDCLSCWKTSKLSHYIYDTKTCNLPLISMIEPFELKLKTNKSVNMEQLN